MRFISHINKGSSMRNLVILLVVFLSPYLLGQCTDNPPDTEKPPICDVTTIPSLLSLQSNKDNLTPICDLIENLQCEDLTGDDSSLTPCDENFTDCHTCKLSFPESFHPAYSEPVPTVEMLIDINNANLGDCHPARAQRDRLLPGY